MNWRQVGLLARVNLQRDFRTVGPPGLAVRHRQRFPAIWLVVLQFLAISTFISTVNLLGIAKRYETDSLPWQLRERLSELAASGLELSVENLNRLEAGRLEASAAEGSARLEVADPLKARTRIDFISPNGDFIITRVTFDVPTYAFLMSGMVLAMTALSVIGEFSSVVVHPDDNEVLGHRPIEHRTYFLGKLVSLGVYVGLVGLALTLPVAVCGCFISGSNWRFFPVFLLVGLLSSVTAAGAVLVLYNVLIRNVSGQRIHDLVTYSHIAFLFVIFLGFQLLAEVTDYSYRFFSAGQTWWLMALPNTWFSMLTSMLTWDALYTRGLSAYPMEVRAAGVAGLLAPLIMLLGPTRRLSLAYAEYLHRLAGTARSSGDSLGSGGWQERLGRWVCQPEQRAGYQLALGIVRRDRQFKVRFYQPFGMPLAFVLIGLFQGSLGNPFVEDQLKHFIYTLCVCGMMGFAAAACLSLIPFNEHAGASWLYRSAPLSSPAGVVAGVKKALVYAYFLPLYAGMTLFLSWHWGSPVSALLVCGLSWVFMLCVLHLGTSSMVRELPFSLLPQRAAPQSRIFSGLFLLILASLGYWAFAGRAFKVPGGVLVLLVCTAAAAALLSRRADEHVNGHVKLELE